MDERQAHNLNDGDSIAPPATIFRSLNSCITSGAAMKAFIISLALVTPAFAAMPETFEVNSKGCMFSATKASCVISNKHQWDMKCNLTVSAKTKLGSISKERKVLIPAQRFQTIEIESSEQNSIVDASASGICTIVQ